MNTLEEIAVMATREFGLNDGPDHIYVESGQLRYSLSIKGRTFSRDLLDGSSAFYELPAFMQNAVSSVALHIALAREMRRSDGDGPAIDLFHRNVFADALLAAHGLKPQDVFDLVWRQLPREIDQFGHHSEWRTAGPVPAILGSGRARERGRDIVEVEMPDGTPWMYGSISLHAALIYSLVIPGGDAAFRVVPVEGGTLHVSTDQPETVQAALLGRPLGDLIDLPVHASNPMLLGKARSGAGRTIFHLRGSPRGRRAVTSWFDQFAGVRTIDTDMQAPETTAALIAMGGHTRAH